MANILIVDDDQNLRRIVCHLLGEDGHKTLEARNVAEAEKILTSVRPDAILLDVMMPGVNGFDLCKKLKSRPSLGGIPVILCTARGTKEDIIRAVQCGADDYLLKPFTKDTLLRKVRAALEKRPAIPKAATTGGRERRRTNRKAVAWEVSWGKDPTQPGIPLYRNRVANISLWGFAFEFPRCLICTGYEQGTVHPLCLLAPQARRFNDSQPLDFILSISSEVVIEVRGRVAHVYQPPDWPATEIVGIAFEQLSPRAEELLRKHLA
jgi:CheY-like chemotaxis protein